jgi:geranylgeranyl diphosphate synthase type I
VERRRAKGVRPRLCLLACEAVGGPVGRAVPAAAAIELTHEFSLIHDDLEDGDRRRRGQPALWTVIGAPQAINAGDALFAIARDLLRRSELPCQVVAELQRRYDHATMQLAEGQYLDLAFESRADVDEDAYVAMVQRKTGALLGAAAAMGALAGGAPASTADALAIYGEAVGVAFQIQDDVLGLWGEPRRTGKPAGADLQRRKKSLPIVMALAERALGGALAARYAPSAEAPSAAEAAALAARLELAYRGRSEGLAQAWALRAMVSLSGLDLAAGARQGLETLARAAVYRER